MTSNLNRITVTRRLEFDAAHRVMDHESKCANLHGHRYVVEVQAAAEKLDSIGRVIDFSVLKGRLGEWLDQHWDHNVILCAQDGESIEAALRMPRRKLPAQVPFNPTAENMADYLLRIICPSLFLDVPIQVTKITVWETPNCRAEAVL